METKQASERDSRTRRSHRSAAAAARDTAVRETAVQTDVFSIDDGERIRAIKQSVLSDVSCVLARASGAEIDPNRAFGAARNVCEILFAHPLRPRADIPKLFWDTPLGRAVGVCCGEAAGGDMGETTVKTTLHLPFALSEKLRLEAELTNKSVADLIAERLM